MSSVDPMAAMVASITRLVTGGAVWITAALVCVLAIKVLLLPRLRGLAGERQVAAVLDRIGADTLHDVILPDDHGGLTQVDHLVLTGAGLLVVETKNYRGSIFGQARESQWTQRLGRRSFRFQNPLRQNYCHTQAVQALVPGVPVFGRVVFTDDSRFPKGMPDGVSSLCDLRRDLHDLLGEAPPSPQLVAAWARVKGKADRSKGARKAHLAALMARRRPGSARPFAWHLLFAVPVLMAALWVWSVPKPVAPTTNAGPAAVGPPLAAIHPAVAMPSPGPPPVVATPRTAAPVTRKSAVAVPSPVTPPVAATPRTPAPVTLEWSDPDARSPGTAQADCNSAIAALLSDHSQEKQRARDRACGQDHQAGAVRPR